MEAKILFADDDPALLALYQEELAEEGYKVIMARNGKEAVARFSREKPNRRWERFSIGGRPAHL